MTLKKAKKFVNSTVDDTKKKIIQPIVDRLLGRTMSRKLQVIIVATWLVYNNKISGDMWGFIALLYMIGIYWLNHVQAMAKLGMNWRGKTTEGGFGNAAYGKFGNDSYKETNIEDKTH